MRSRERQTLKGQDHLSSQSLRAFLEDGYFPHELGCKLLVKVTAFTHALGNAEINTRLVLILLGPAYAMAFVVQILLHMLNNNVVLKNRLFK